MPKYKQTRLFQKTFKVKQTNIASRLIQSQTNKIKKKNKALVYLLKESHTDGFFKKVLKFEF